MIENSDGLEFFPIMFDYMRRKYDLMAFSRYLSSAQAQHFCEVFDYRLPGVFVSDAPPPLGLNLVEENRTVLMLAEKEFVSRPTLHALKRFKSALTRTSQRTSALSSCSASIDFQSDAEGWNNSR